jgi:hypothetical protein
VSGTDVYVAGSKSKPVRIDANHYVSYMVPLYWKSGTEVDLTDGRVSASAGSIFLSGSDVYMAGAVSSATYATDLIPAYWKNGTLVQLLGNSNFNFATSIWANGADVYVAGADNNSNIFGATYWKDGTINDLWKAFGYSNASQITLDGTDVYVSGDLSVNGGIQRAGYWKNGVRVDLSNYPKRASANSIVVVTH